MSIRRDNQWLNNEVNKAQQAQLKKKYIMGRWSMNLAILFPFMLFVLPVGGLIAMAIVIAYLGHASGKVTKHTKIQ